MIIIEDYIDSSFNHLKKAFKEHFEYSIKKEDIFYNEHKKPYLKNNDYFFSISHTQDKIAIAIANSEVGIDIEEVRTYNPGIEKRLFTKEEKDYINKDHKRFTEIFTKKESYGKYLGTGLGEYLKDLNTLNKEEIKTKCLEGLIISVTCQENLTIKPT